MKTVCKTNQCSGCMACTDICPKNAIYIKDELYHYNAVIREDLCVECNACHNVCQNNQESVFQSPLRMNQGWAKDNDLRMNGSSGGYAMAIAHAFIEDGGKVCSCTFQSGRFVFKIVSENDELKQFSGSKYVKSDPSGCYKIVKDYLKAGDRILFIGLPCQVAAMKLYVGNSLESNLYTIDLLCHGTPSPKLLELFLHQYGYSLDLLRNIQFREKNESKGIGENIRMAPAGIKDRYSIAFLDSLTYTESCYACKYARKERVSDLTLGDSWGTILPDEEKRKGISLALCQSLKGEMLLSMANIVLKEVDGDKAIACNQPLNQPTMKPLKRDQFFKNIVNRNFNNAVFSSLPKQCIRQNIKQVLIKTGIKSKKDEIVYSISINKDERSIR